MLFTLAVPTGLGSEYKLAHKANTEIHSKCMAQQVNGYTLEFALFFHSEHYEREIHMNNSERARAFLREGVTVN